MFGSLCAGCYGTLAGKVNGIVRRTTDLTLSLEPSLLARPNAAARYVGMSRSELLDYVLLHALHEDEVGNALDAIAGDRGYDDPGDQERVSGEQVFAESQAAQE